MKNRIENSLRLIVYIAAPIMRKNFHMLVQKIVEDPFCNSTAYSILDFWKIEFVLQFFYIQHWTFRMIRTTLQTIDRGRFTTRFVLLPSENFTRLSV